MHNDCSTIGLVQLWRHRDSLMIMNPFWWKHIANVYSSSPYTLSHLLSPLMVYSTVNVLNSMMAYSTVYDNEVGSEYMYCVFNGNCIYKCITVAALFESLLLFATISFVHGNQYYVKFELRSV